jgi:uncharacterized membrane protein
MPQPATEYVRQLTPSHRAVIAWLCVSAGALVFMSLILAAPLAAAEHHETLAATIYHSFGLLCHQIPERSFFIAGNKLAVCSRCTGIYLGFTITVLLYPLLKSLRRTDLPPRKWLIAAAIPLVVDFSLTIFGIWENTHSTRFATGVLIGSVGVFYVMPGIVDFSLRNWRLFSSRAVS